MDDDPLGPSKGVINGILIMFVIYSIVIVLMNHFGVWPFN